MSICKNCGETLIDKNSGAKYCNAKCGDKFRATIGYYNKPKIYHPRMRSFERWVLTGQNSSNEAMQEVIYISKGFIYDKDGIKVLIN